MLDSVVLGCGGVGSFALRALSQRTSAILGVEQFSHNHNRGSSNGGSRIYRKAYFEHSNYVPWIQYSERVFRELTPSGTSLVENCGTLLMEERDGPILSSGLQSARDHDIPVQLLSNQELRYLYPQFRLYSNNTVGLLEPGGGFIRPERAMTAALEDAKLNGATVWDHTTVTSVNEYDTHVELVLDRQGQEEMIPTKSLIITAGAWTSRWIPSWMPHLTVTRQLQGWINVNVNVNDSINVNDNHKAASTLTPSLYHPAAMPTWYMSTPESQLPLYGIPADPWSDNPHWMKIGIHLRPNVISDPCQSSRILTDGERAELVQASALTMSAHPLAFAATAPCLYTMTPDHHFLLGHSSPRIVSAAGLSGHGFKMTPALGAILVDMALDDGTAVKEWNTDFCSPRRFGLDY